MRIPIDLPAGWPWSIWFFIITLGVYLLQRFPMTGVFLMIVGAAFWSVLLINAGMIGIVVETLTGRASPLWLAIPSLYFGCYYAAYFHDQSTLARVQEETARFNEGKSLPFDGTVRDLVVTSKGDNGSSVSPSTFVEKYDVPRAFDGDRQLYTIGTSEVCKLINSDHAFMSAGIQGLMLSLPGEGWRRKSTGFCRVVMPGRPDQPVTSLVAQHREERSGLLGLALIDFIATDSVTRASAAVRSGIAGPLKRFPMPVMGCALNSGAPSWDCFHGFMRDSVQLVPGLAKYSRGEEIVARMLGIKRTDDHSATAIGTDVFQPIADRIAAEATAKDLANLERMLTAPATPIRDGWLRYLPDRPDIVAPYAPRIFAALEALKKSGEVRYAENGQELWKLVSRMSDKTIAPYRPRMAALMQPPAPKYTFESFAAYQQWDVTDPIQRAVLLDRVAGDPRKFVGELLPPFCRMGAAAPPEVKQRLLALWKARAPGPASKNKHQLDGPDLLLYLTLARMGLKTEAGQVEQQYHGPDFRIIWERVTPETPDDICVQYSDRLGTYFREKGWKV